VSALIRLGVVQLLAGTLTSVLGAIIIQISYGLDNPEDIKSLSHAAETIVQTFGECATPGRFLVDLLPFLRYVPSWFPGAGWKRRLLEVARISQDVFRGTFDDAKERAVSACDAYLATLIDVGDVSLIYRRTTLPGTLKMLLLGSLPAFLPKTTQITLNKRNWAEEQRLSHMLVSSSHIFPSLHFV
jgi:hypothetical protein